MSLLVRDLMQKPLVRLFWAGAPSVSATLMVAWWIGIQERSLSLSLSASGYWPSQAQRSSVTALSESNSMQSAGAGIFRGEHFSLVSHTLWLGLVWDRYGNLPYWNPCCPYPWPEPLQCWARLLKWETQAKVNFCLCVVLDALKDLTRAF